MKRRKPSATRGDAAVVRAVADWFAAAARPLPWREIDAATGGRDPYHSLVSEFMLQQTQVSRVLEKFGPFVGRFPTTLALARADEGDVLAMWSGLGYYRRARNLHGAAKAIVERFGGRVPRHVGELESLPGVGRYTAGSIASIAFGEPAGIVDGNVTRVLLRLYGKELPPEAAETKAWVWSRAEELAKAAGERVAAFNEGLMELGATVCTPGAARCGSCPLGRACIARKRGVVDRIPAPKARREGARLLHAAVLVRDGRGRVLVERRPDEGLWAGMWQAPTIETSMEEAGAARGWLAGAERVFGSVPRRIASFERRLTHRLVVFEVYEVGSVAKGLHKGLQVARIGPPGMNGGTHRAWKTSEQVAGLGLSNPQRKILLEMAPERAGVLF